ncbi:MAG: hypothetical protein U0169_22795, partial [Polyangiaceae bacterium]
GNERTACKALVGAEVVCREARCADGTSIASARCDGLGSCPTETRVVCSPYACGATACLVACRSNSDCVNGVCDATGKCVVGDACVDRSTLRRQDGTNVTCGDYVCQGSSCRTECVSVDDCADGLSCSSDRKCTAMAPVQVPSDGGCASVVSRQRDRDGGHAILLVAVAVAATARRRSRQGVRTTFRPSR